MKARIGLGALSALLLVVGFGCAEDEEEPFRPTSIKLVAHGEFLRDEVFPLEVIGVDDSGKEVKLEEDLTFVSSNEEVATVDEKGVVTVHAGGPVTITATYAGDTASGDALEAFVEARATCVYPEYELTLGQGKVVPPLFWPARRPNGEAFIFRLEDVYCDAEWQWVKTIHFVFSAGWCGPCSEYAKYLSSVSGQLRREGMQVVTIELDTLIPGTPATTDFAYNHLKNLAEPIAGISAGDLQTFLDGAPNNGNNFLRKSGFVQYFPTRSVVRTRDMRMIADASATGPWSEKALPLLDIARDPEADWSKPDSTTPGQPGEPSGE
jgi:hypothetical protein